MYNPENKSFRPRVQLRPSLLEWMISWHRWSGTDTYWKSRDIRYMTMLYIKITRAPTNWRIIADNQVAWYLFTDRITNQEAYVELCTILDMIGDYFTKALQEYQFRRFCNIIIGIHENYIPSYNFSVRALIEERKINLEWDKVEYQKADKLAGYWFNQGVFWMKLVNELPMNAQRAQEGMLRTNILCHTSIFSTYIVWCQWTQLDEYWRNLWHVYTNVRLFVIWWYKCKNIPWWEIIHS